MVSRIPTKRTNTATDRMHVSAGLYFPDIDANAKTYGGDAMRMDMQRPTNPTIRLLEREPVLLNVQVRRRQDLFRGDALQQIRTHLNEVKEIETLGTASPETRAAKRSQYSSKSSGMTIRNLREVNLRTSKVFAFKNKLSLDFHGNEGRFHVIASRRS